MYRKYLRDMTEWKDSPERKPLIVWGARQVGKTYLVKDLFAEQYFKGRYVYIDCRTDYRFTDYCLGHVNADDILKFISVERGIRIDSSTLLIFDEAQECPPVITLMKYFCQDHREIPVIVTGSMIRMSIKRKMTKRGASNQEEFLFPIGKINQLTVYPMTFDEVLYNRNEQLYDLIKEHYAAKKPLEKQYHDLAMDIFYDYMRVGGMPEAVDVFLRKNDINAAVSTLADLYDNYLADMELYQASPESVVRSKVIFSKIFSQLNTSGKNFKSSAVEPHARNRDLQNPMDWLTASHLIQISEQKTGHVTLPLVPDGNIHRIYLCDVGMFSYQSKTESVSFITDEGRNMLSGIFFENYVATELAARKIGLYYWCGKGNSEFEFIVPDRNFVIPIIVKKSRGTIRSLEKFKKDNEFNFAIKVSANNYRFDETKRILTVPFYEFPFLADDLAKGNNLLSEN